MIKVRLGQDTATRTVALKIKGHANQTRRGHDLICAAASILAYTAAQDVRDAQRENRLAEEPTIRLEDGRSLITATAADDESFALLLHTFFVVQKGFLVLQHNHPRFLSVRVLGG